MKRKLLIMTIGILAVSVLCAGSDRKRKRVKDAAPVADTVTVHDTVDIKYGISDQADTADLR
ncbi:MAG: hypothetical protein K2H10_00340, partial [Bacteroidales bacterium]|nr:hypothetical protein [Bacteroidales bacterium]